MKHSFLFVILAAMATSSCNNNVKPPTEVATMKDTSKVIENKIMIPLSSCFSTSTGKDSVHLKVEVFENVVTGKISYKFYEKDSNTGDFEGQLRGDTLLADYIFNSEGKKSVRQVVFLIKDNVATEGYGDMEEKNGKMVFKNLKAIVFGEGMILTKVPCGEN